LDRAVVVVVVEGATLPTTMIIIGVLLNVVGLGVFCWALFALAIHALPFFVGIAAAIYTYQTGAGPLGAIIVASLRVVSHSCSGSTPSPSRARPLSALSLGCYSRFQRHAPGMM
jgi:hypothetical protein